MTLADAPLRRCATAGSLRDGALSKPVPVAELPAAATVVRQPGERLAFLGWFALVAVAVANIPALWLWFFSHVAFLPPRADAALSWAAYLAGALLFRRALWREACASVRALLVWGERFMAASMTTTVASNLAYLRHAPGPRLPDVGFALVPEQAADSPWRPASDLLTAALPLLMAAYAVARLGRRARCALFVDWFRLVGAAYLLRAATSALTSLPGPAPHCRGDSAEYLPPAGAREVLTRLGPLVGACHTCGDLLFSGHTAWTTITLLLFLRCTRPLGFPRLRRVAAALYLLIMGLLVIAGRKHYTVDVALGVVVGWLVVVGDSRVGWGVAGSVEGDGKSREDDCKPVGWGVEVV